MRERDFGQPIHHLGVSLPSQVLMSRERWNPDIEGSRVRQFQDANRSRLAGIVTRNVGHDTPRDHHVPRHGHRNG